MNGVFGLNITSLLAWDMTLYNPYPKQIVISLQEAASREIENVAFMQVRFFVNVKKTSISNTVLKEIFENFRACGAQTMKSHWWKITYEEY